MSAKHTFGPWVIECDNDTGPNDEGFCEWFRVGPAQINFDRSNEDEARAAANLFAAAPDLIAVLKEAPNPLNYSARDEDVFFSDYDDWLEKASDTIAKAEGQS